MAGTSENTFGPNVITIGGMIVTILYRLAWGVPWDIEDENWGYPFTLTNANAYYGTAVLLGASEWYRQRVQRRTVWTDDAITRGTACGHALTVFAKAQGHDDVTTGPT